MVMAVACVCWFFTSSRTTCIRISWYAESRVYCNVLWQEQSKSSSVSVMLLWLLSQCSGCCAWSKFSVHPVSVPATCYLLLCPRICWPRNTPLFQSSCLIRQAQFLPFHLQSVLKHTNPQQYHYFSHKIGWIIVLCHRVVLKIALIWTKHSRRAV